MEACRRFVAAGAIVFAKSSGVAALRQSRETLQIRSSGKACLFIHLQDMPVPKGEFSSPGIR
jgi:hypothetical protein